MLLGRRLVFCLERFLGDAGSESIAASENIIYTDIQPLSGLSEEKTNTARLIYLNSVPV